MMKKLLTILMFISVFGSFSPVLAADPVYALGNQISYDGFVKCDGVLKDKAIEPGRQTPCNFAAFVDTVIKAINWMFIISIPIATVLFAYGGILYMTGQKDKITTAKKIFKSVGIGFIIMLVAWFGVKSALTWFVESDSGAGTFLGN